MLRKLKNLAHLYLAIFANIIYGFPSRRLTVIGVTGTDGKTTTSSIINYILNQSGHRTAMITTVGAVLDGKVEPIGFHVTTPSAFALQRFLKKAADSGHEYAVIETSSHGIDQNRIWGIHYKVAVITNISHEHLDYHKTFEAYKATKLKFLQSAESAVINLDDPIVASFKKDLKKVVTYSRKGLADVWPENFSFKTKLFGNFNESNCLAAIAVAKELGISDDKIQNALETVSAPKGRQEIVYNSEFKVMIDFAHTPNAIENVMREAKATNPSRLIHVYGAPGRRDIDKRPLMGQASSKYADVMVITADDPRDEKIGDVISQIRKGVSGKFILNENLFEIEDRKEAIKKALAMAKAGDFVVLTGKGHEQTLAIGDKEIPWDEREVVLSILNK